MPSPIIEFCGFTCKYRTQAEPTLFDINLKIYEGEKVLIIGESGSGKSTITKCINGFIPSSCPGEITGSVKVCGLNPAEEGIFGMSKHVGTVLQDTDSQFIGLTVAEDIAFAMENDNMDNALMHQKVNETADIVNVKELLKQVPTALSGGQKQRVSLAGILVDNVDVLLFDEPLANLDPAAGKKIIALIDEISKDRKKTIVIIEHRLEDVLYKDVDRIIVIEKGRIVADCPPNQLLCTNLLTQKGIREPFYIAALKYAGCQISEKDNPQNLETMNLEGYKDQVKNWSASIRVPHKEPSAQTILEAQNLCFSYEKGKPIVKDISFSIKQGEMLSIVGTNGAGKSTLASLICGFIKPDSGKILLEGKDIAPLSIKQRGEKIGFVMQNQNQMISKSIIFDEVALGLVARKVPADEIKQKVCDTLKICGMYPYRNWPVSAISFGQKKRITIASILVMDPKIIILDEPTAGQDYAHYTEIMDFLKKLNEELGITIIMITHDMHLMLEYTDRAIVISDGRILTDDKSSRILTDKALTEQASLKETSLYTLALKCGISDPADFADRFIHYEQGRKAK